jgi:hypothetical protein
VYAGCCFISTPYEPSTSKAPRENLEILLKRSRDEVKEQESKWFNSGTALTEARDKVATYSRLLKNLGE